MTISWEILLVQSMRCDVNKKQHNPAQNLESLLKKRTQAHLTSRFLKHVSNSLSDSLESTRILLTGPWRSL
jgi:hypothetical protein